MCYGPWDHKESKYDLEGPRTTKQKQQQFIQTYNLLYFI